MKAPKKFHPRLLLILLSSTCAVIPLPAQPDQAPEAAPAPAPPMGEFVVTLELLVSETGAVVEAKLVSSDDENLEGIAEKIALGMKLPVRAKEGTPIQYRVTAPLSFPVEGDGGSEAAKMPLPTAIYHTGPQFPFELSRSQVSGGAILELTVDAQGRLKESKVLRSSHALFGKAALTAVRKWKFKPAQKDGQPIEAKFFQAVVFEAGDQRTDWRWYVAPRPRLPLFTVSGQYVSAEEARRMMAR